MVCSPLLECEKMLHRLKFVQAQAAEQGTFLPLVQLRHREACLISPSGLHISIHAHVDIFFRLRNGKIIPGRAVDYFPRTIPPSTRGSIPLSHFFAQFDALPEQAEAVLLRFHEVETPQCDLAIPKDCKDARRNLKYVPIPRNGL